jgi:oxygen-independent coproporphyrinogen-3 oxidase
MVSEVRMTEPLYSLTPLERSRRHFINSYPPFNVTRSTGDECLDHREDLLLYVHIPFCPTICTYCFYKKFGAPSSSTLDVYLDYLKREIAMFAGRPDAQRRRVKTLYFGGGTPSVLSNAQLVDLIGYLKAHFDLSTLEEFCCEIMPHRETADAAKIRTLREIGVTRLSFGVETFDEELLRLHNRPCTRELYESTYAMVLDADFDKVNIDMMSGLAGASWATLKRDVDTLLAWSPPCVSIYKTEVFYNTSQFSILRLGRNQPALITDDEEVEHIRYAHRTLVERGGYFNANDLQLIKDWQYCDLHFRLAWEGVETKGLGLSAHSCYEGVQHQNASELDDYYRLIDAGRLPIKRSHRLTSRDRISQWMVYGLKNLSVDRARFVGKFGLDMTALYGPLIELLAAAGAVELDADTLRITPSHYVFADDICRRFFLPEYEHMMPAHVERGSAPTQRLEIVRRNEHEQPERVGS